MKRKILEYLIILLIAWIPWVTYLWATAGDPVLVPGSAEITTVGTIGTGTWQGTAVANGYVAGLDQDCLTTSSPTFAGLTQVGDAANNMSVAVDGEINLAGTARVTTREYSSWGFSNANSNRVGTIFTYDLDPNADEAVEFYGFIVPDDFAAGTNVSILFRWHPTVANGDGVDRYVYWRGYYHIEGASGICVVGDQVSVSAFSTTVPDGEARGTIHETTWKTISGLSAGDVVMYEIYRDADNANDDYGNDVGVWRCSWFKYTVDKLGEAL